MLQDLRLETSKGENHVSRRLPNSLAGTKICKVIFFWLAVWISGPKAKTENECELHCLERKCT